MAELGRVLALLGSAGPGQLSGPTPFLLPAASDRGPLNLGLTTLRQTWGSPSVRVCGCKLQG